MLAVRLGDGVECFLWCRVNQAREDGQRFTPVCFGLVVVDLMEHPREAIGANCERVLVVQFVRRLLAELSMNRQGGSQTLDRLLRIPATAMCSRQAFDLLRQLGANGIVVGKF